MPAAGTQILKKDPSDALHASNSLPSYLSTCYKTHRTTFHGQTNQPYRTPYGPLAARGFKTCDQNIIHTTLTRRESGFTFYWLVLETGGEIQIDVCFVSSGPIPRLGSALCCGTKLGAGRKYTTNDGGL